MSTGQDPVALNRDNWDDLYMFTPNYNYKFVTVFDLFFHFKYNQLN